MTERIGGRLGDLQVHIENAQEKFKQEQANLFRADGSRMFSEDEHNTRLGALTNERNAVLSRAEEDVRSEMVALDENAGHVKNRDAAELLTTEELKNANERRAFARDSADTLGVSELIGRLRSVMASGDKGTMFAYFSAAQRRRHEILRTSPAGKRGQPDYTASATEIDGVLAEMRRALDPNAEAEIEALKERQEKAARIQSLAWSLQRGGRDSLEVYQRRAHGTSAEVAQRIGARMG